MGESRVAALEDRLLSELKKVISEVGVDCVPIEAVYRAARRAGIPENMVKLLLTWLVIDRRIRVVYIGGEKCYKVID